MRPQSREATSRDDSASIPEDLEFEVRPGCGTLRDVCCLIHACRVQPRL